MICAPLSQKILSPRYWGWTSEKTFIHEKHERHEIVHNPFFVSFVLFVDTVLNFK